LPGIHGRDLSSSTAQARKDTAAWSLCRELEAAAREKFAADGAQDDHDVQPQRVVELAENGRAMSIEENAESAWDDVILAWSIPGL
jgi:hypothetical protein